MHRDGKNDSAPMNPPLKTATMNPLVKVYNDEILRLAKSQLGAGKIDGGVVAQEINPMCGDDCLLSAKLDGDDICDIAQQTRGCILCLAAAAKMIALARQTPRLSALKNTATAFNDALKNGAPLPPMLQMFAPLIARKSRHHCVLLPFLALMKLEKK